MNTAPFRRLCVAFVVSLALATLIEGVDRNKFRTCDQTGFCKRHRAIRQNPPAQSSYALDPSSIKSDASKGSFEASLSVSGTQDLLTLTIHTLENGAFRMRIKETNPLFPRFEANDALDGTPRQTSYSVPKKTDEYITLAFAKKREILIKFNPFLVTFIVDGKPVIQSNRLGLFSYEVSQQKPENYDNSQDSTGLWEETFGGHRDSKPRGPQSVGMDFTFVDSEYLYGIPEHASQLTLKSTMNKGDPYRLFNLDVFEYELDSEMAIYGAIPFMLAHDSQKTTGLLWLNAAETWIDISEKRSRSVLSYWKGDDAGYDTHWFSAAGIVDVFFFHGDHPYDVIEQYTDITGKTAMPQMFSIGYHQCRWNYRDQEDVATVNAKFDEYELPMDVIWLDIEHTNGKRYFTWDRNNFKTPREMLAGVASKGRKMVTIVDPHLKIDQGYTVYKQAEEKGLLTRKSDGANYDGWCWSGSSGYLDFVNPSARDYWASMYSFDNYVGSDENLYIWNDMNEPSVFNGPEVSMNLDNLHFNNAEHREVHNIYGFYVHMATHDGLLKRHSTQNDRPFVLSRAFFSGSQRFGAIWTGDNAARWDHLKVTTPMLTSLGIAGMTNSGADIGGFFGNPEPELLVRWYQAAAYQPFFRGHAHLDAKRREPYLFDEPYLSNIRNALRERYALIPLIYTLFYEAHRTGIPVMRPMWTEFPKDPTLFAVDDQFMLGKSLLVKPITNPGETQTPVSLPEGVWYPTAGASKDKSVKGPQTLVVNVEPSAIPVFQRGGTIIPRKDRPRRSTKAMENDPYTLYVALDEKLSAEGDLYQDDGSSFKYRQGEFLYRTFTMKGNKLTNEAKTQGSANYGASSKIERIVVLGVEKQPSKITLSSGSTQRILDSEYDAVTQRLTIRKPDAAVNQSWTISFQE